MKPTMKFIAVSAFALLVSIPAALAQTPEASLFPVTEPLDAGGTILQPGVYLIRVLPSRFDRNKVQITDRDRTKVYATLLTVPHPLKPNEEVPSTRFIFFAPEGDHPLALRTWFAPDPKASQGGHDIVYQQGRATQLARLSNVPVVSYPEETTLEQFETATLSIVTPEARIETYVPPPPAVIVEIPPPPMISQVAEVQMPETASKLPLITILGVMFLAGALMLRFIRPE